jgi:hypothetical protein
MLRRVAAAGGTDAPISAGQNGHCLTSLARPLNWIDDNEPLPSVPPLHHQIAGNRRDQCGAIEGEIACTYSGLDAHRDRPLN